MEPITCLVIDDDLIDRLTTVTFLRKYPCIKLLGHYESPVEGLAIALHKSPDVLILDINMPGLTGLQIRRQLMSIPACIFITSYPEYAAEGFEVEALDYLVKPFTDRRFEKMMSRLSAFFEMRRKADKLAHTVGQNSILIKEGTNQVRLQLYDVLYLEATKDYTCIVTAARRYMVLESMSNLLKNVPFGNFVRIHRSYAVNKHFIKAFNSSGVILNENLVLPVGRKFKDALKNLS